jgi:hypothetical protein
MDYAPQLPRQVVQYSTYTFIIRLINQEHSYLKHQYLIHIKQNNKISTNASEEQDLE